MIRVLRWGLHWTFFAFCGAVIAGFSFDGRLELLVQPVRTIARTGTILVAVALATPLYFAFEVWLAGVHWVRSQYPRGPIWRPVLVLSAVVLAVAGLYSWFGVWALRLTWRTLDRWSLNIYALAQRLVKEENGAELVPHVENMRRKLKNGRRKAISEPAPDKFVKTAPNQ